MKQKKFHLNWVDGLIVLVVIGLVAGTFLKFRGGGVTDSAAAGDTPITYQVFIGGVRQYTVDAIQVGDTLYDRESDREVGVIREIEARPGTSLIQDPDGAIHEVEAENRFDLYLTVDAKGTVSDGVYTISRIYTVNVGSFRQFYTKYSAWQGRIWSILA